MTTIINDLLKNDGEGLINVAFAILCSLFAVVVIIGAIVYLIEHWVLLAMFAGALLLWFIAFVITDKITKIWEN